jgi:hypothetical protein
MDFDKDQESERVYEIGTDRKLFPKETELADMKLGHIGKQNTRSTYGSSDLRQIQFLEDQNDSVGH